MTKCHGTAKMNSWLLLISQIDIQCIFEVFSSVQLVFVSLKLKLTRTIVDAVVYSRLDYRHSSRTWSAYDSEGAS